MGCSPFKRWWLEGGEVGLVGCLAGGADEFVFADRVLGCQPPVELGVIVAFKLKRWLLKVAQLAF